MYTAGKDELNLPARIATIICVALLVSISTMFASQEPATRVNVLLAVSLLAIGLRVEITFLLWWISGSQQKLRDEQKLLRERTKLAYRAYIVLAMLNNQRFGTYKGAPARTPAAMKKELEEVEFRLRDTCRQLPLGEEERIDEVGLWGEFFRDLDKRRAGQ